MTKMLIDNKVRGAGERARYVKNTASDLMCASAFFADFLN